MMRHLIIIIGLVVLSGSLPAAPPVQYVRDVVPILERYCIGCHTQDVAEGEMVMESHRALLSGGASGPAITPGTANSSRLLLMVTGQLDPVMPPDGEERPTEEEIEVLTAWIEQGAQGPSGNMPLKRALRVPKIESGERDHLPVTAIAISPDGRLLAVARYGRVDLVREDQSIAATLSSELEKVNALQFDREGARLLVASGVAGVYGSAVVFSVDSGELIREFVGHRDALYAARFSPDESMIATAGYDHEIILWDVADGEAIRRFEGHNGAVFDLAFSPDGKVLVTASADETVKVWSVESGQRLDTLSQPEGEVFAVDVTSDGRFIVAGSADNRLRVWRLRSIDKPAINPIVATRFVDQSPLVDFQLTPDGDTLVVLSQAGKLRLIQTEDWNQVGALPALNDSGSNLSLRPDGKTLAIGLMNGRVAWRELPNISRQASHEAGSLERVYLDLGPLAEVEEANLSGAPQLDTKTAAASLDGPLLRSVPRGVKVSGVIGVAGEADHYRWQAAAGEVWAIDVDATQQSPLDPIVTVLDENNEPVLRTRLQATRSSYFTFRGKNSSQSDDFRLFNWQDMQLNRYLYSSGEVTRLWMHPRGPDSGFKVYPGEGDRWTYFGTTHTTHALGEPAYIVRPLRPGESPAANGLPVFDIVFENDDDPMRIAETNSRLLFTAPADGMYTARVADTRRDGGDDFAYQLTIRAANPSFQPSVEKISAPLRRGTGREFIVRVDRYDGFQGPVTFDFHDLPAGAVANVPLTIEPGQRYAVGTIWVDKDADAWDGKVEPQLVAQARIQGRRVERPVGSVGELSLDDPPSVIPSLQPLDRTVAEDEDWILQVRRGETVSARVVVWRQDGFDQEISFGKESSGRNASQGVYVDNIGLNGLLVRANENHREFFLTADPIAAVGERSFFLTAQVDGNVTTHPISVEVLPAIADQTHKASLLTSQ